MAAHQNTPEETRLKLLAWLETTPFATKSLQPLSGGQSNFTYHAKLSTPFHEEDGSVVITEVVVKHGEPYMARHPANAITTSRCDVEAACLREVTSLETHSHVPEGVGCSVRAPKCYFYDEATKTQCHEYLPKAVDLKTYLQTTAPLPVSKQHYHLLGRALAEYVVEFHTKTASGRFANLLQTLGKNDEMRKLKHMINFDWLLERVDQLPNILRGSREAFEGVKQQALEDMKVALENQTGIHGDFCPQNVLLVADPSRSKDDACLFLVDWENAQLGARVLDHGEMLGELYLLWMYKDIDSSLGVIQGYCEGLGKVGEESALRIASHVGVHVLSFGTFPGLETPARVEEVIERGRDIVVNASEGNVAWFKAGGLASLFT